MSEITVTISFYDDLLESDLEALVEKGLDTDQNIFRAIIKNMIIS